MAGPLQADRRWRWAAASRIGTSHHRLGTRKQDAFAVRVLGHGVLCAVVSDGAGSASHGGQGASLTCRILLRAFGNWFSKHDGLPDDEELACWVDELRDKLAAVAAQRGLTRRQFAATLALMVVHDTEVLTMQVGDSPIVGRTEGTWQALCWPETGEFASTTYFVTDDPTVRLNIARTPLTHDGFALFSDGLDAVALDHAAHVPYGRFFDPMMKPVDGTDGQGRLRPLSAMLGAYLDGERICERTDDDKTLILLSCQ